MKIVSFYRGERANQAGVTLDTIMNYSHGAMEIDHDYIQWLFPSNEPSALNGDAPVLSLNEAQTFQSCPELQEKVKQSFLKFLDFLGMKLVGDDQNLVIEDLEPTDRRASPQWWMDYFNHNMLRVTRVLKSLRLTGLDQYASALYEALKRHRHKFSDNTFGHWTNAATGSLWQ